jgi:AGCS family alanine or glycine:cation symporter
MTCKMIIGFIVAAIIGFVIIGGVRSIATWCTRLVPLMALLYVIGCIYILFVNHQYIIQALQLIVSEAFSLKAFGGGTAGTVIMMAARYGIARGLFSNESGMGSAPIVAAAAQTRNPVRQALVSSTGTFWDTVVICAITGMVVVTSIIAYPEISQDDGGMLTKKAFSMIPYVGTPILTFGIITFAFSTILGWSYYGERAVEYLGGRRAVFCYRVLWILLVLVGSVLSLEFVWNISDLMNAFMAIPNLIALIYLSNVIAKETDYYLWKGNLDEETNEET